MKPEKKCKKRQLCRCNNCMTVFIDENPDCECNQPRLNVFREVEFMGLIQEEGESFFGCPYCGSDKYLIDLLYVES